MWLFTGYTTYLLIYIMNNNCEYYSNYFSPLVYVEFLNCAFIFAVAFATEWHLIKVQFFKWRTNYEQRKLHTVLMGNKIIYFVEYIKKLKCSTFPILIYVLKKCISRKQFQSEVWNGSRFVSQVTTLHFAGRTTSGISRFKAQLFLKTIVILITQEIYS